MLLILFPVIVLTIDLPYYYHSTSEILDALINLDCEGLSYIPTHSIHAFRLSSPGTCKAFLLFGEHPRELISPELGYYIINELCAGNLKPLENTEILFVINANPKGREKVEEGEYCTRYNENDVDINRNWDRYWEYSNCSPGDDTCSGPYPFSEIETRDIKDLIESFKPDLFVSIHSGLESILIPYAAIDRQIPEIDKNKHLDLIHEINHQLDLVLEFGSAPDILGYLSAGNCLDYAYDVVGASYAYAWEIYEGKYKKNKHSDEFAQVFIKSNDNTERLEYCFGKFNPSTHSDYLKVLKNWTRALEITVELACNVQTG
jgi:Zinc carboxypeptidase